jgi:hypothetical protein
VNSFTIAEFGLGRLMGQMPGQAGLALPFPARYRSEVTAARIGEPRSVKIANSDEEIVPRELFEKFSCELE